MAEAGGKKRIAIFGSTGSIGTQALDVVRTHPEEFEVVVLTAQTNDELLIAQALEHKPDAVVIGDDKKYERVKQALSSVPGGASSITYQDTSALMGAVFQTLVDLAKNPAMQEQAPVDASAAPDAATLSKYWGDAVGYVTRDSRGYFFKSTLEHKK